MKQTNDPGPSPALPKTCSKCGQAISPFRSEYLESSGNVHCVDVTIKCIDGHVVARYPYVPSHDDLNRIMKRGPYSPRKRNR
jgi:hypothetical protein